MAGDADRYAVSRRHHLAALAYETRVRGLDTRLVGPSSDVLHIAARASGRATMVVATTTSDGGWSYLWSGGGFAAADDPSRAAELIAAFLGR